MPHPKINNATAQHAIDSIEQLVGEIGDIITSNAREWGAGIEADEASHAVATIAIAHKLLIQRVLKDFPIATRIRAASLKIFGDAGSSGIDTVIAKHRR